jgi:hypothetical protein
MKKLLFIFLFCSIAYSQTTRTPNLYLPQWNAGDILRAGTTNDTSQANTGINNLSSRIDAILGYQMNKFGLFKSIRGYDTLDLTIDAGYLKGTPVRVNILDSVKISYNLYGQGNALFDGNLNVGGYIRADSLVGNIVADTIGVRAIDISENLVTRKLAVYSDASIENGLNLGSDINDGKINLTNIVSRGEILTLSASYIFGGIKSVVFENRSGVVALQTGNDSLQAPTVHAVLFNSEKIASSTLNDTSGNFTEWTSNSTTKHPIVRLKYLHKAGITNIVARYYAYISGGGDAWEANIKVGSLTSSITTDSNTSYDSVYTTTLNVSGLTADTLYTLTFNIGTNTMGVSHFKELIITAESNQ